MIVILKENTQEKTLEELIGVFRGKGLNVHVSRGSSSTILGLVGDTSRVDIDSIRQISCVANVKRVQEPYKDANRKFHPLDTVIKVGDAVFGGGTCTAIAGPCSVESEEQILAIAQRVKAAGASVLRGGAFKPRTSPYSFQGLRNEGIRLLLEAKKATGLPVVTEIMDISQLDLFSEVDIIQVGARNMQNFELLKHLGNLRTPILLKRGLANTYQELLMSAEYIMSAGNEQVILCERGIRTFENAVRNTLDISAVPVLKKLSHLPVVVDPSHAAGFAEFVPSLAVAAAAAGADGLMIEVHNDPAHALCDGIQSITPDSFAKVMKKVRCVRTALQEEEA